MCIMGELQQPQNGYPTAIRTRHCLTIRTQIMDPQCALSLTPVTPEQLALSHDNPSSSQHLLLDIRPSGQFCSGHIQGAENLNFSNILLRRLLKGVVKLETMLTSPELVERVCCRRYTTQLVLCDAGSSADHCRPELLKHAEVLVINCLILLLSVVYGKHSNRSSHELQLDSN